MIDLVGVLRWIQLVVQNGIGCLDDPVHASILAVLQVGLFPRDALDCLAHHVCLGTILSHVLHHTFVWLRHLAICTLRWIALVRTGSIILCSFVFLVILHSVANGTLHHIVALLEY